MYVNQSRKMIYFHNPKTGGRSAIETLGFEEETHVKFIHMTAVDAKRRIFQETWSSYHSLAFVRNPWDRMVSLYAYHRSLDYGMFQGFNHSHQVARLYSFSEWLTINAKTSKKSNWFGVPQSVWTEDVTEVHRFEKMQGSLDEICNRFGLPVQSLHKNKSDRGDYQSYYSSQEEIDIVAEIDAETIKQFNYQF